jgi:hypothetical protein
LSYKYLSQAVRGVETPYTVNKQLINWSSQNRPDAQYSGKDLPIQTLTPFYRKYSAQLIIFLQLIALSGDVEAICFKQSGIKIKQTVNQAARRKPRRPRLFI